MDQHNDNKTTSDLAVDSASACSADLEVEMREAWKIIDVLYMDALDHNGESWPRAREWQERNQIFSPQNGNCDGTP